jgi:hypothetical protein
LVFSPRWWLHERTRRIDRPQIKLFVFSIDWRQSIIRAAFAAREPNNSA